MWLLTCAQNKRYILGTNSEKYENLCKGIKNMEKYKQTTLCIIYQQKSN
jgi:hypothetical protein